MKTLKTLAIGAAVLMGAAAFSSCSDSKDITGTWTSSAPEAVVPAIDGASAATAVTTFEFKEGSAKGYGPMKLVKDYTVTLPADSLGKAETYTVNASVEGTWTRSDKDAEDYTFSFDQNSLSVSGVGAPELGPVTSAFLGSLAQYTSIEDMEISNDGKVMKFELDNKKDAKVVLNKVESAPAEAAK